MQGRSEPSTGTGSPTDAGPPKGLHESQEMAGETSKSLWNDLQT